MQSHFQGCAISPCYCNLKRYWLVLGISSVILIVEIIGGVASRSLALLSDAAHVFQDMLVITIAILIELAIRRGANEDKWRRRGAYLNALFLLSVAAWIVFEAIERFGSKDQILSGLLIVTATIGGFGNYIAHRVLESSHSKDITHRGLSVHILSDLWQSVAVVAAGILIALTGFMIFDLVISILIAIVFAYWSVNLFRAAKQKQVYHSH
ncbi:MAG: cation efflux system protein, CDF family [Parcubacteria group bacterium Gr01-1014_20]|nr:MAG: cation efflux system protein, CDF family [Parcubacteria group bacterium Gr01-1014_20]